MTRGDEYAVYPATGVPKTEHVKQEPSVAVANDFAFIRPGAPVAARIGMRLAMELAANGAGDTEHEIGHELLRALHEADEPLTYPATVKFPAPTERAEDPRAPVSVEIPGLDDSGGLFVLLQTELEPASPQPPRV